MFPAGLPCQRKNVGSARTPMIVSDVYIMSFWPGMASSISCLTLSIIVMAGSPGGWLGRVRPAAPNCSGRNNSRSPAHQRRQPPAVRHLIPLFQRFLGGSRVIVDDHPPILQLPPGGEERPYRVLGSVTGRKFPVSALEGILALGVHPRRADVDRRVVADIYEPVKPAAKKLLCQIPADGLGQTDGHIADLLCWRSALASPDDVDPFSPWRFCILKSRELKRIEETLQQLPMGGDPLIIVQPSPVVGLVAVIADWPGFCRRVFGPTLMADLLFVVRVIETSPGQRMAVHLLSYG